MVNLQNLVAALLDDTQGYLASSEPHRVVLTRGVQVDLWGRSVPLPESRGSGLNCELHCSLYKGFSFIMYFRKNCHKFAWIPLYTGNMHLHCIFS